MASAQLQLISNDTTWKLDRRTVQIGRAGLAQARAALAAATAVSETDIFGNTTQTASSNSAGQEHTVSHQAAA